MTSKEELDSACIELPGKNVKYTKNSRAANKTIKELKSLLQRFKRLIFDENGKEQEEYLKNIETLLWVLGKDDV